MKKSQIKYSRGYIPGRSRYSSRYSSKKKKSRKKGIIFLWCLFLIAIISYILFFSPIFKIKEIKISNNLFISSEEIQESIDNFLFRKFFVFFNHNNVFIITEDKLFNILSNDFPRILLIEMDKNIFKKIVRLKIVERKEAGIFCRDEPASPESQRGECYYIDKQGVVFEKAPQTSGSLILVIKDTFKGEVTMGENVIEQKFMQELIRLREYLFNLLNLRILDFIIESNVVANLRLNTNEGWYIVFDRSRDLENQLDNLRLVLEEKLKGERKNLEYIDLRIENRAYYK